MIIGLAQEFDPRVVAAICRALYELSSELGRHRNRATLMLRQLSSSVQDSIVRLPALDALGRIERPYSPR